MLVLEIPFARGMRHGRKGAERGRERNGRGRTEERGGWVERKESVEEGESGTCRCRREAELERRWVVLVGAVVVVAPASPSAVSCSWSGGGRGGERRELRTEQSHAPRPP